MIEPLLLGQVHLLGPSAQHQCNHLVDNRPSNASFVIAVAVRPIYVSDPLENGYPSKILSGFFYTPCGCGALSVRRVELPGQAAGDGRCGVDDIAGEADIAGSSMRISPGHRRYPRHRHRRLLSARCCRMSARRGWAGPRRVGHGYPGDADRGEVRSFLSLMSEVSKRLAAYQQQAPGPAVCRRGGGSAGGGPVFVVQCRGRRRPCGSTGPSGSTADLLEAHHVRLVWNPRCRCCPLDPRRW